MDTEKKIDVCIELLKRMSLLVLIATIGVCLFGYIVVYQQNKLFSQLDTIRLARNFDRHFFTQTLGVCPGVSPTKKENE